MPELIENSASVVDVAKVMKSSPAQVEADARDLNLCVGHDWSGKPAVATVDAAALVSGSARREANHAARWQAHTAASEAWETERERRRASAFHECYDAALREGRGAPAAAAAGHEAARRAVGDFERKTPPPEFDGKSTSTRWLTQANQRIKEVVS